MTCISPKLLCDHQSPMFDLYPCSWRNLCFLIKKSLMATDLHKSLDMFLILCVFVVYLCVVNAHMTATVPVSALNTTDACIGPRLQRSDLPHTHQRHGSPQNQPSGHPTSKFSQSMFQTQTSASPSPSYKQPSQVPRLKLMKPLMHCCIESQDIPNSSTTLATPSRLIAIGTQSLHRPSSDQLVLL